MTSQRNHLRNGFAGVCAALFQLGICVAQTPEYLASEEPIPSTLEETRSATEGIGIGQDSRGFERMLQRRRYLPELRKRIPRTGEPFFDDAVYHVSPRAYYRYRDDGDGSISEAFAAGGEFGVETGYLGEILRFGFTGYTSQDIYGPSDRAGSGLLEPVQESYTVLGEAYADIKTDWGHATLYRQRLDIPYLNASDVRMTPNTFEAYGIHSTAIPNLAASIGHVQRIKFRNSTDFEHLSEHAGSKGSERGVTVAGARYEFTDKTFVGLIGEYGWDTFHTTYFEAEHYRKITDDLSLKTGLQFTDQRSVGDELLGRFDAQHLGYKLSIGYQNFILTSAFTWTSGDHGIRKPWGGSPSYNSVIISDFDRAGERAFRTGISYDFSELGLEGVAVSASWLYGNTPDSGSDASPDQQEFNVNLDYRPSLRGLDNFWLRLRYASNDSDAALGGSDRQDLRMILNYSISF